MHARSAGRAFGSLRRWRNLRSHKFSCAAFAASFTLGRWQEKINSENAAASSFAVVEQTIDLLLDGHIVAIKGIGGFHLCVDATNEAAVMRLRERKRRYGKPLAVMVRDFEAARTLCALTAEEESLLFTPARPIVLARRREGCGIAEAVAPGIPWLGLFLPYAPLQHLLFADARIHALVMTSANLSEEPIAIDNEEAQRAPRPNRRRLPDARPRNPATLR